jgi:Tektin family
MRSHQSFLLTVQLYVFCTRKLFYGSVRYRPVSQCLAHWLGCINACLVTHMAVCNYNVRANWSLFRLQREMEALNRDKLALKEKLSESEQSLVRINKTLSIVRNDVAVKANSLDIDSRRCGELRRKMHIEPCIGVAFTMPRCEYDNLRPALCWLDFTVSEADPWSRPSKCFYFLVREWTFETFINRGSPLLLISASKRVKKQGEI